jgi:hypothetical protein
MIAEICPVDAEQDDETVLNEILNPGLTVIFCVTLPVHPEAEDIESVTL